MLVTSLYKEEFIPGVLIIPITWTQPMLEQSSTAAAAWNFFSRKDAPDLWCAVPVHRSVPDFLLSGRWRFGGQHIRPGGFRPEVAINAEELSGFYIFHRVPNLDAVRVDVSRRPPP